MLEIKNILFILRISMISDYTVKSEKLVGNSLQYLTHEIYLSSF